MEPTLLIKHKQICQGIHPIVDNKDPIYANYIQVRPTCTNVVWVSSQRITLGLEVNSKFNLVLSKRLL